MSESREAPESSKRQPSPLLVRKRDDLARRAAQAESASKQQVVTVGVVGGLVSREQRWWKNGYAHPAVVHTRTRTTLSLTCAYNHPRRAPTRAPPFTEGDTHRRGSAGAKSTPNRVVFAYSICAHARCSRTFHQSIYTPPHPHPHPHGPHPTVRPAPN